MSVRAGIEREIDARLGDVVVAYAMCVCVCVCGGADLRGEMELS